MSIILAVLVVIVLLVIAGLASLPVGAIIGLFIAGLVIGALARLIIPGRQRIGLLMTALIGAAGSIIGGLLATEVLDVGGIAQFVLAIVVAAVLVAVVDGASRDRSPRGHRR